MSDKKYTEIMDLDRYCLDEDIQKELNYLYQRYCELCTVEYQGEFGIMPILPDYFAETQKEWAKYLSNLCILFKYDTGQYVGYFYKGVCKGKLIIIEARNYTVVGVFRDFRSFTCCFWSSTLKRFSNSLQGDYPDDTISSDLQVEDCSTVLWLYSLLEKEENFLTRRLIACMITKVTPQSNQEQLKKLVDFPDSFVQISLFKTLRYYKYKEAADWLETLLIQDNLSEEVRSEAELAFDMICYPASFKSTVTARGKYIKWNCRTQYGDVLIRYEPIEGEGLQFSVKDGQKEVPSEFYQAIESGFFESVKNYKGFRLVGLKAVLIGGSTHREATEMAYKIASALAFREALKEATIMPIKD